MKKITYVTGNWSKIMSAKQILEPLGIEVDNIKMETTEIQAETVEEVAMYSAKEASDIIILDDNFLSISKAVLYGRTIFKSIRKFIILQLTINMCAMVLSLIGPFVGIDTPVTVIQMLWINMVMDTLAGVAFAFEPPLLEYMKEHPKKKDEPIINKYMRDEIFFTGAYSSILCIIFLKNSETFTAVSLNTASIFSALGMLGLLRYCS